MGWLHACVLSIVEAASSSPLALAGGSSGCERLIYVSCFCLVVQCNANGDLCSVYFNVYCLSCLDNCKNCKYTKYMFGSKGLEVSEKIDLVNAIDSGRTTN